MDPQARPRTFPRAVALLFAATLLLLGTTEAESAATTSAQLSEARRDLVRARSAHPHDHPALADAYATFGDRLVAADSLDEAEKPMRVAYDMRRRLHGDLDPSVARSLDQLGNLEGRRRNYAERLAYHQQALDIRRRVLGPDDLDLATSLEVTSRAYTGISDWGRGEALLREALAIHRRVLPPDDPRIAGALMSLGDILRWQNELAEAEEFLREAVAMFRKRPKEDALLAGSLEALAMLHRFKSEHDEAESLLVEVIAIRRRLFGENSSSTFVGRANLALNHAYQDRRAEANREFEALRAVLSGAPAGVDVVRMGQILDAYMCGAAEHARDWPTVERYALAVLAELGRNPHDAEHSNYLRRMGQARAAQGDLEGAARYLAEAAVVYEQARLKMSPGLKTASFKKTPYEPLALARLEKGTPAGAWEAVEAARGRVLADEMLRRRADGGATGGATAPPDSAPFPLARIQVILERDQAIVAWLDGELYPGALRSWACVIRKSGPPRWVRLQAGGDLASLSASLSEFRESVERGALSSPGSADGSWIPQARALWKARVAPLEPHLRGVKELVLIPSWTMGSFPVDMLVDEKGRFVGERFAIAHAPSATVYALLRGAARRGTADPRTALLVGDPPFRRGNEPAPASEAFTVATLRSAMRGDARAIESLPRLKHSRDEIAGVAKLMPDARVLLGGEASETAVASLVGSGAISRFHVVHFATHALVDYERPQRSGLVLSQLDAARGVPERDGIVTGAEITESWKLDANLVTLSACQTAIGRTIFGEGVVGLSYPIFQAGARSLLVSQWKVDDEATALLMTRFYHNWLGEGAKPWSRRLNKAASLREAKRWLREYRDSRGHHPFDHPFYWAAFVLVGDPD